ncbi:GNAT family N-acetyltransferase [Shewanella subflava]|uniref:GNAT family N-acetyltransferase n=1 Tax=Shewanella subflava TaxID=2986476 RepID=A0ABT3I4T5_9GAMM|nr:GNAT family N-acetyltransferase [Shewanella subflava]MCW3171066.1 GNAT family N-acetyltransferase [Shewanella subflava]
MDIALYSDRLIVRSLQQQDWLNFLMMHQDIEVNKYIRELAEENAIRLTFEERLASWSLESGQWLTLVVETLDKQFVGLTGFYCQDCHSKRVEVGYLIAPNMQGYGYATESLQAVIDWGRLQFNIHKYVAVCERGNFASQKVLTKLGFNLEAEFLQHTYLNGKWVDDFQFGLVLD